MRRDQLEHIIRAAADVTKQKDLIIIGSQAILGQYPNAPESLLVSMEADIYAPGAPHLAPRKSLRGDAMERSAARGL